MAFARNTNTGGIPSEDGKILTAIFSGGGNIDGSDYDNWGRGRGGGGGDEDDEGGGGGEDGGGEGGVPQGHGLIQPAIPLLDWPAGFSEFPVETLRRLIETYTLDYHDHSVAVQTNPVSKDMGYGTTYRGRLPESTTAASPARGLWLDPTDNNGEITFSDTTGTARKVIDGNNIASQLVGNLLLNPSFEKWSGLSTTGSATDKVLLNWSATGGVGIISKETTIVKNSDTSVKILTSSFSASAFAIQYIENNVNIALLRGKTVTLSGWARNNSNLLYGYINLTDGYTSIDYTPPADNTWHSFSLTISINSGATTLQVKAFMQQFSVIADSILYVDSLSLVVGSATSENSLSSLSTSDGGVPKMIADYNNSGLDTDKPAVADMLVGASYYATDTGIEYYRNA